MRCKDMVKPRAWSASKDTDAPNELRRGKECSWLVAKGGQYTHVNICFTVLHYRQANVYPLLIQAAH
jgi:hypothetical protein